MQFHTETTPVGHRESMVKRCQLGIDFFPEGSIHGLYPRFKANIYVVEGLSGLLQCRQSCQDIRARTHTLNNSDDILIFFGARYRPVNISKTNNQLMHILPEKDDQMGGIYGQVFTSRNPTQSTENFQVREDIIIEDMSQCRSPI